MTAQSTLDAGSGKSLTKLVRVTNLSGVALKLDLGIEGEDVFSVDSGSLSLGAGDSAEVRVTLDLPRSAATGDHSAILTISSGETKLAHSVLYVYVK